MAFTDRFLSLPVEMYDKKQAELTGNDDADTFTGYIDILPMEIRSFGPAYDEDHNMEDKVVVYFKGDAESIVVLMPLGEFKKSLNQFMDK